MSGENEVFHAVIAATDDASATIEGIRNKLRGLGAEAHKTGEATSHIHRPHMWTELNEHISLTREHFGELHTSVSEVGNSITELLPALGAFAVAGSFEELFELAHKTAESYAELAHTAESLGVGTQELHKLNDVAYLTDTNVESMDRSLGKLNRTLAEAAAGKNKDAAALFAHLHMNPASFNNSTDALFSLADAFKHTTDATMRGRMAMTLFGRAGVDMIPMLMQGGDALKEHLSEASKLSFNAEPYKKELLEYNDSMKELTLATQGFEDELGSILVPILGPIVNETKNWVIANRDWIATDIAKEVGKLANWVKTTDWHQVGVEFRNWEQAAENFVEEIGGAKVVVEGLAAVMAFKGVMFLAEPIADAVKLGVVLAKPIYMIGTELVAAWSAVGAAALAADAAQEAAIANAFATGGVAAGVRARMAASAAGSSPLFLATRTAVPLTLPLILGGDTVSPKDYTPDERLTAQATESAEVAEYRRKYPEYFAAHPDAASPVGAAPSFAAPLPPGPGESSHRVTVDTNGSINTTITLNGFPSNTVVQSTAGGVAAAPTVHVGQAWHDTFGR